MSASSSYEQLFEIFTTTISEGILVVDKDSRVIALNKQLLETFGYEREDLEGKSFEVLIPEMYREPHKDHFKGYIHDHSKRRMASGRILYGKHKDGDKVPIEVGLTPVKIEGELFVVALIIDVTRKYETEKSIKKQNKALEEMVMDRTEQLNKTVDHLTRECQKREIAENKVREALKREKELNAIKTSFMQMVSHEFKTPLSGILTSAMLIEKYSNSEQQDKRLKHLESIKRKVQHLDALLNDFLAVERLGSGRDNYRFSQFWLNDLMEEVAEETEQHLTEEQTLLKEFPTESISMYQDRVVINLILSNVLNNAVKYSGDTGNIVLRAERLADQGLIKIQVTDNGMGIPQEEQQYIFSRYFRASNAKNIQGTGIGLNMSKKHLQNLGGHIFFTSREGEGSVFTIMLPEILQQ
ncbi:PAS domain-containing sensor histidine kinase [Robertkochia sediminum]|uniref:PAS domain-containing sensor histidine kinase n=1 Tax=Robertkochia sediminum TaxID=2785326 RepID=UPI00193270A1|nr:PAS domain-containing sensor histidine kinase [Robertkochia sediminum]MBL7473227.1 PAS domain S-box protein [Robertkochia sediminum]